MAKEVYLFQLNKEAKERGLDLRQTVNDINIKTGINKVISDINRVISKRDKYQYEGLNKLRVEEVGKVYVTIEADETENTNGWKHEFAKQLVKYCELDDYCIKSSNGRHFFNKDVESDAEKVQKFVKKLKELYEKEKQEIKK